jgi:phage terminase large subunit GpA-like protein
MLTQQSTTQSYRLKVMPPWVSLPEHLRAGFRHSTRFSKAERRVLRRRKTVLPSEWCEQHRVITKGAMAGALMRMEHTPHVVGQMDALFFPSVRSVTVCAAPQTAKSTMADSCILYSMDMHPGPCLSVYPDRNTAEKNCRERIHLAINKSGRLRKLKTGNKDDFTTTKVQLTSMLYQMGWSGSAISLSNDSYRYLDLQEVDKYPESPNAREAGTLELAGTRVIAYPNNHKILITSTPTTEKGPIWQALTVESEVIFDYYVRCPYCDHEQTMIFDNIHWPKGDDGHSIDYQEIEKNRLAWYECEHCHEHWDDYDRNKAIQSRTWRQKTHDDAPRLELFQYLNRHRPQHIGFHQPSWISSLVSLSKVAGDWLKCSDGRKDYGEQRKARKNFYNKHRAEPWTEIEATRQGEELLVHLDERPDGIVPGGDRVACLLFGADTQDDGFYYTIWAVGYGRTLNMWLVKAGFVVNFEDLETVLWDFEYKDVSGSRYPVQFGLIDSKGHRTSEVYDWTNAFPGLVLPTSGERTMQGPYTFVEVEFYPGTEKKKFPGSLKRVRVNTTYYKDKLDGKLRIAPVDPGAVRFHGEVAGIQGDFCAQLCAEVRDDNGFWQQIGNRANHYWDCSVLAMVAADIRGIRFWPDPSEQEQAPPPPTPGQRQQQRRKRW